MNLKRYDPLIRIKNLPLLSITHLLPSTRTQSPQPHTHTQTHLWRAAHNEFMSKITKNKPNQFSYK